MKYGEIELSSMNGVYVAPVGTPLPEFLPSDEWQPIGTLAEPVSYIVSGWADPESDPYGDVIRTFAEVASVAPMLIERERQRRRKELEAYCVIESELVPPGMELHLDSRSLTPMPRPSTEPPMWAVQPQRSKRNRKSSRRVK